MDSNLRFFPGGGGEGADKQSFYTIITRVNGKHSCLYKLIFSSDVSSPAINVGLRMRTRRKNEITYSVIFEDY